MDRSFMGIVGLGLVIGLYWATLRVPPKVMSSAYPERRLELPHWTITVKAAPWGGHVYFVASKDGRVLPSGMSAGEMKQRFPDLYDGLHQPLTAYESLGWRTMTRAASISP